MRLKNRFFWIAAIIAIILDQLTKYWVVQKLSLGETHELLPGILNFTYTQNKGAAWSFLSNSAFAYWLRWLSLAASLVLMAWASFGSKLNYWEQIGWGLILGGAMGNGIDRFRSGKVVDFIYFILINFPIFNLADVFINIGIVCLLIATFRKTPTSHEEGKRNSHK